jgi:hypothetical protein
VRRVLAVLPLLAGIGTSWQQAVIGQVGVAVTAVTRRGRSAKMNR